MTHYMELLSTNQPWNLILFMAVPIILAETVAITELYILFTRKIEGMVRTLNRTASIVGGVYFTGVFGYLLLTAAIPLTTGGEWRGIADVIAVTAYLAGVVPLLGMALLDLGAIASQQSSESRLRLHASLVALFLVVAHVAMIFGMLDPTLLQSEAASAGHPGMMH